MPWGPCWQLLGTKMRPKGAQEHPEGSQKHPKGTQEHPKGIQEPKRAKMAVQAVQAAACDCFGFGLCVGCFGPFGLFRLLWVLGAEH